MSEPEGLRVLVCGGRDFKDRDKLYAALDDLTVALVIHGGARGADTLAGEWAAARGVAVQVFPADWAKHRKRAGVLRNIEMLATKPDLVVAFPGGRGTDDMVRRAVDAGVEVWTP